MDLIEAFRILAETAEMNIATDSSIEGKITLYLDNVSFLEAMDILTKTNGLSYKIIHNTIFVAPTEKIKKNYEAKLTRVFKLKNSDPEKIKENLDHLIDDGAIKINQRTNSLIITTYESNFDQIEETIAALDYSRRQIALQVRFEEISHTGLKDLGVNWEFSGEGKVDDGSSSTTPNLKIGNLNFNYSVSLEALESSGVANVLANPKITTIEGEEANINIGDEIPILTLQTTDEDETSQEIEFKNIGIDLKITPKITDDNNIFIDLQPEITTFLDWVEINGTRYPTVSIKKVGTKVKVNSGETLAIGGLIQEKEYETMSKVPLLGDLPILGKLFSQKNFESEKRELIIFITPKIINDNSGLDTPTKKQDKKPSIETENINDNQENISLKKEQDHKELLLVSQKASNDDLLKAFIIQVGAFDKEENARNFSQELKKKGFEADIVNEGTYKVQLGPFKTMASAQKTGQLLKKQGLKFYIKDFKYHKGYEL
ncbi:type IV pilus assembly protein PilQ [Orenia metallireducens]|jgi:type IV pilus assembly protein PilQ|uniref:Type IV pilus assembly protein PilQ n=1 Tax=Orenia metallireducens TaxID=1413210 RepID=A0A285HJY8_9FIRM|nr:SPOR domain-containing protein [Orenia metallireducens]PRX26678.1 type IV pilus assembly protein PilQ [Orenia metallireducens]SNY36049.1 type IV pilus assembly protein PilQ [Orenia metallireducens]